MDSQGPDPQRNGSARDRTVTADEDRRSPCTAIASVAVCEPLSAVRRRSQTQGAGNSGAVTPPTSGCPLWSWECRARTPLIATPITGGSPPASVGPLPLIQYCFRTYGSAGVAGLTGSAYAQHDPAALPAAYCEGRSPRDSTSLGASRRSSMLPHLRVRPVGLCTRSTCLRAGL